MKKLLLLIIASGLLSISPGILADTQGKVVFVGDTRSTTEKNQVFFQGLNFVVYASDGSTCLSLGVPPSPSYHNWFQAFGPGTPYCNNPDNPARKFKVYWTIGNINRVSYSTALTDLNGSNCDIEALATTNNNGPENLVQVTQNCH